MELLDLYKNMYRARSFERAIAELWGQGLISGEMHLGTGEEAVAAGVAAHIEKGDAVALDHRSTPVLNLLGVDLTIMLKELLGCEDGLCHGMGGHMHLFSREHLAASSGIVGSAAPIAAGFALAAKRLRPGRVGVAFFGDGACNQGMLLEALNLAAAWSLPAIFVCKDNGWAITTRSTSVTGGGIAGRAEGFGMPAYEADGLDVSAVWETAGRAFAETRSGKGPRFLHFTCSRLDGHFLGDPLLRMSRRPIAEGRAALGNVASAVFSRGGGGIGERAAGVAGILKTMKQARDTLPGPEADPLARARRALNMTDEDIVRIEGEIDRLVGEAVEKALAD
jgi:TPP-dependent pyruvate/acetoin dehydrogenase alpha subunit